ncbi:MAG: DUF1152 domain-containing protein [Myxococcaceae bacterium]|nr:DUF1152 domain-containing protein [Myxococcaceae bacterium]
MSAAGFLPAFADVLARPEIRTVLLAGCGGGFDFVHGLMLWPALRRMGKTIVVGSYSFGDPAAIRGGEVVFGEDGVIAKRVDARALASPSYGPEVHAAAFLDARYPADAPHSIYAYYARDFTVARLTALYQTLIRRHEVDAVVLVDGGSDSLMAGDEEGLGDPIEDAVSIATVAGLEGLQAKLLLAIGVGADRFNHVSDAATLRAIAELSRQGGYLGALGLDPAGELVGTYRALLDHLDRHHSFRSVLAGSILAAADGYFGGAELPPRLASRVAPGELFLWPLMSTLFGFDVEKVAARSRIASWVAGARSVQEQLSAVLEARAAIGLRPVEDLPRHADLRNPRGRYL